MGAHIPICLADFFAVKAIALVAAGVVAYLYWSGIREKLDRRRERKWLEDKRRELKAKTADQSKPPPGA